MKIHDEAIQRLGLVKDNIEAAIYHLRYVIAMRSLRQLPSCSVISRAVLGRTLEKIKAEIERIKLERDKMNLEQLEQDKIILDEKIISCDDTKVGDLMRVVYCGNRVVDCGDRVVDCDDIDILGHILLHTKHYFVSLTNPRYKFNSSLLFGIVQVVKIDLKMMGE